MKKYFIFSCIYLLLLASACNEDQEVLDNDPAFNVENTTAKELRHATSTDAADDVDAPQQKAGNQSMTEADSLGLSHTFITED